MHMKHLSLNLISFMVNLLSLCTNQVTATKVDINPQTENLQIYLLALSQSNLLS